MLLEKLILAFSAIYALLIVQVMKMYIQAGNLLEGLDTHSVIQGPATSKSGNLLEMQNLGPIESES